VGLAQLTDREAVIKAVREYNELGREGFLSKYGFGPSRRYVLIQDDAEYDSKAIAGAAHGYQFPEQGPLRNADFVGGVHGAARKLRDLGFEVKDLEEPGAQEFLIRDAFEEILEDYVRARMRDQFGGDHPLQHAATVLTTALRESDPCRSRPSLVVKSSLGIGNWSKVPWVALMDSRETDSTTHGVYCVYLFRQDMSGVYLTLNQGVVKPRRELGWRSAREYLATNAGAIRQQLPRLSMDGFLLDDTIDLRADAGLGRQYEDSTIGYKLYESRSVPDDRALIQDLEAMLGAYDLYLTDRPNIVPEAGDSPDATLQGVVDDFAAALRESHVVFGSDHESMVRAFVTGLTTKGFVILTGLSGSGKTQLALRFGDWLGAGRSKLIPVRPDWTGAEALFGFEDALQPATSDGRLVWHVPTALEFMLTAAADPLNPYILILDEMNLAHVERYFADVLSGIESAHAVLPNLGRERDGRWRFVPSAERFLPLPRNLFVCGTVNVDETTYAFSPKVLDRANVYEFRVRTSDLAEEFRRPIACRPGDSYLVTTFLRVALDDQWHHSHPADHLGEFANRMRQLHALLSVGGWEFGYRVFYESVRYASILASAGEPQVAVALDQQVMQKILPRLHGSRRQLESTIRALGRFAYDLGAQIPGDQGFDLLTESLERPVLTQSFEKLRRMLRSLQANQFASFSE
jgi:5-methylcytosine-specific restriction protein B